MAESPALSNPNDVSSFHIAATASHDEANASFDRTIRIISWVFLATAGFIQAWFYKHYVYADGISYLEIATHYAKGDWHSALNSYWSPLYSWIIAALMVIFRVGEYWQGSLMHFINYGAYLVSLYIFELLIKDLISFQERHLGLGGFSKSTVRLAGNSVMLVAGLVLINMSCNSPDTVAMAIGFYILHCLMRIEAGSAQKSTYVFFGFALSLEYLCRSAFAVFVPFYILIAAVLLWNRRLPGLKLIVLAVVSAFLTAAPFVVALSVSKGRFTIGDAGKLNYGWEIDGAARSTNWQGEPFDIGRPIHGSHQSLTYPATYTFAKSPVPGSYPLWYEPSYWYEGIKTHLKFSPQLHVLVGSLKGVLYLFLRSPITIPVLVVAFFMGWRKWLSFDGLLAYWFILVPTALYILAYCLVFLDSRYIAGSLVVVWMCLLTSVTMANHAIRHNANRAIQVLSVVFAIALTASKLVKPVQVMASDIIHRRETYPNFNWILAQKVRQLGFKPGDKIAMVGLTIDAEWARMDGLKFVGEIPTIYDRDENQLFRRILLDRKEPDAFWRATPQVKEQVYGAFGAAGAEAVFADYPPSWADRQPGWQQVLPITKEIPGEELGQNQYNRLTFRRLSQ